LAVIRKIFSGIARENTISDTELNVVPYPEIPLEDIYVEHKFLRGLHSKHTRDLFIVFVAILGVTTFVALIAFRDQSNNIGAISASIISSSIAAFGAIYQLAKMRFSTVDVFSSEILARIRILAADSSIDEIIRFSDPKHVEKYSRRSQNDLIKRYEVISPSEENYFEIFYRRSRDLGGLNTTAVDNATDFYSFHMASRDQLRELMSVISHFPDDVEEIKKQVVDVVFMIDLMALSAIRVFDDLIEQKPHRLHSRQLALSVASTANKFLLEEMELNDKRRPEVENRTKKYQEMILQLKCDLTKRYKHGRKRRRLIPKEKEYF